MKKTNFLRLLKTACLAVAAVATVCTTTLLSACGGGGESSDSFDITAAQFRNGGKSFYIMPRATFVITGGAGNYTSPDYVTQDTDDVEGTGSITYDGETVPITYEYIYDKSLRRGTLYFSFDAVESTEKLSAALWNFCTKDSDGAAADDEDSSKTADSLYWNRSRFEFNFKSGQCQLFYDDASYSQYITFRTQSN